MNGEWVFGVCKNSKLERGKRKEEGIEVGNEIGVGLGYNMNDMQTRNDNGSSYNAYIS